MSCAFCNIHDGRCPNCDPPGRPDTWEDVREARAAKVHVAAPAALGENVLRYAPPGAVQLTAPQRADIIRELDALRKRLTDLQSNNSPPLPDLRILRGSKPPTGD